MNTRRLLFIILIAALSLAACSPGASLAPTRDGDSGSDYYYGEAESSGGFAPPADLAGEPGKVGGAPALPPQSVQAERLVIKNASLTLVVGSPAEASATIASIATSLGGFVVSSYTYQANVVDAAGNRIMQANITVRVPSDQLDAALAQIRGLAVEVRTENISGQDVTAEYTDLESQLRNLEAAETQLQRIMDGATKTEDVLSVFNQLTYIRQQIEQVRGQMKYYRESAAMSAITAELLPDALARPIEIGRWRPEGVAKDAIEALLLAFQGIATAAIWLGIYFLPLVIVLALPIFLIIRFAARRLRRPRATTPA